MKITREQFEDAARVAESDHDIPSSVANRVLWPGLAALGIEVDNPCRYSRDVREHCASNNCHGGADIKDEPKALVVGNAYDMLATARMLESEKIWIERAWRDVREGDIVCPPGMPGYAAKVVTIGPVNHWHAAPDANQYRPNESPLEWASIPVTLRRLDTGESYAQPNGMNPSAAVEIRVTRGELAAIEACGGWQHRIAVIDER